MRIIHILLGKANPETMNGVNVVVHNLATQQQAAGHQVSVCGFSRNPEIRHVHSYDLLVFPVTPWRFLLSSEFRKFVRTLPPDTIAHLHSVFIPEIWAAARLLKQAGICYVFSPHGAYNSRSLSRNCFMKKMYLRLFESQVLRNAGAIHAIGALEVEEIKALTDNPEIYLLHNGVNIPDLPVVRSGEPPYNIVYVGRLDKEHKGLDLLIEAFALIAAKFEVKLMIAGDGPDRQFLESLATDKNLAGKVVFCGKVFNAAKEALFHQADLFVHTSRWEGIPTAVMEAAGYGIPLLVTEATNMGKFIRESNSGKVCNDNDVNDIAQKMGEMLMDLANYAGASRRMAEQEFPWPLVSARHVKEYRHVLEK